MESSSSRQWDEDHIQKRTSMRTSSFTALSTLPYQQTMDIAQGMMIVTVMPGE